MEAIIARDYNTDTNETITEKKLFVNSGVLTVNSGNLTVVNELINNVGANAVIIENNANLIQGTTTTVNANIGDITVKRNSSLLKGWITRFGLLQQPMQISFWKHSPL